MKVWKWGAVALCLLALTACSKQETVSSPVEEAVLAEQVLAQETEKEPAPRADFTFLAYGEAFEGGCAYFGGTAFVELKKAMELPGMTGRVGVSVSIDNKEYVSLADLCEASGLELIKDDNRKVYLLTESKSFDIPEGYDVPVLMYHGVTNDMWGMTELFVKPESMEEQIAWLTQNGYTTIWFEDLPHVDEIEKPVILTFDDGYMDNYTELYPILQKYNAKATIFVVTGIVDYNPRSLTTEQIRELSDSGLVSIQSHTATHPYLGSQSREVQEWELTQSKLDLIAITGKEPTVICYPSGSYDTVTLELAKKHYRMGIDMNGLMYTTGEDPYRVERFYIRRQDSLETVIGYIQ